MRSSGNNIHQRSEPAGSQAEDEKHHGGRGGSALYIAGIGPGGIEHMSGRAKTVIAASDTIAGYTPYIDLVRPLIAGKNIISTGMQKEVDRVWQAIEAANSGRTCTLVCSGDPGVYAMAGLVFEMCMKNNIAATGGSPGERSGGNRQAGLFIEVVPGVPALCAGAALLGAPLMHDFASISLSDLLTPWDVIEKRICAAAAGDFVIALYNPKSKKRNWQLNTAKKRLLEYRAKDTPVGLVTSAMREDQHIRLCTLESLNADWADMQTIVFIGNSTTFIHAGRMITPRGYDNRYDLARTS